MSISELLVPNTLNLYANSITTNITPAPGPISTFDTILVNGAYLDNSPIEIKGRQNLLSNTDNFIGLQASTNLSGGDDYDINIIRNVGSNDLSLNSAVSSNIIYVQQSSGEVCINTNTVVPGNVLTINGNESVNTINSSNIISSNGTITTLGSTTGTINTLNSTNGTITTLGSTTGTINTLNSTNGTITTLDSTTGTINTLNSTNGTITTLGSTTANINTANITNLVATNTSFTDILLNGAHLNNAPAEIKGKQLGATNQDYCIGLQASNNSSNPDDYDINIIRNGGSNDLTLNSPLNTDIIYVVGSSGQVCINTATPVVGNVLTINGNESVNTINSSNILSTNGTINTLGSTTGTISTLNSTNGTITTLGSTTGTIATLNSTNGTITTLGSTTGTIATLNSTNGTITTLGSTTANITNLNSTNNTLSSVLVDGAHLNNAPIEIKGKQFGVTNQDYCIGLQASNNTSNPDDYDINIIRNGGSNDLTLNSPLNSDIIYVVGSSGQVCINTTTPVVGNVLTINGDESVNTINSSNIISTNGTISTLGSTNGTIATLNSTNGTITTLGSTTGTITTLNSTNGTITTLGSTTANIGTANISTALNLPNITQPATGTSLLFYQSMVIATQLTGAFPTVNSNVRLTRVGKLVALSVDRITSQVITGTSAISFSATIPAAFLPDFTGGGTVVLFNCYLSYSDTAIGSVITNGIIQISNAGGVAIHMSQPIGLQSLTEVGYTNIANFVNSGNTIPTGAAVSWNNINISYYCGN